MPVSLFTFVDLYDRALDTAAHILTKGAEHARSKGVSDAEMLDWRLIDDMNPLRFQLMVVCNFPRQWPARVAGLPVPEAVGADMDLAGFRAAIAEAKRYLAALTPEQFAEREETLLTVDIGQIEPTLPAGRWLTVFSTTNVYFHLSMAYAILRANGVPIGKIDLFPTGL
ncbi:MAG: hypothetical protein JWO83_4371 [Caulobacteraceae bacterium]|nr:hypothetical protein [Caulobacteraceae bacterium]